MSSVRTHGTDRKALNLTVDSQGCCLTSNVDGSGSKTSDNGGTQPFYGHDLARVHHEHFDGPARLGALEVGQRLAAAQLHRGTIVDLGCAGGVSAAIWAAAGFDVIGIDLSPAMIELAREQVPGGRFECGSVYDYAFEPGAAVAVASISEVLSYATDPVAGVDGLRRLIENAAHGLVAGGVLVFDVLVPGAAGPTGRRSNRTEYPNGWVGAEVVEDVAARRLERRIETVLDGRRSREVHQALTFDPNEVAAILGEAGFAVERLAGYAGTAFPAGVAGFAATKR